MVSFLLFCGQKGDSVSEEFSYRMSKQMSLFVVILVILAGYALYAAQGALHRGERMAFIVLLFIAVLFWKRVQKSA